MKRGEGDIFKTVFCSMSVECTGQEKYANVLNHDFTCEKKLTRKS